MICASLKFSYSAKAGFARNQKSRFTFMCDKILNYNSLYLLISDL